MPEVVGSLRTPRLASAPGSPTPGQLYYDNGLNKMLWWDGTKWVAASDTPPNPLIVNATLDMSAAQPTFTYDCSGRTMVQLANMVIPDYGGTTAKQALFRLQNLAIGTPWYLTVENQHATLGSPVYLSVSDTTTDYALYPVVADRMKIDSGFVMCPPGERVTITGVFHLSSNRPMATVTSVGVPPRIAVTGSYAVQEADIGSLIEVNSASPCTITVRDQATGNWLPSEKFTVRSIGAGAVTIAPPAGTSLFTSGASGSASYALPRYASAEIQNFGFRQWMVVPSQGAGASVDATTSVKGVVQLAGDLAGTAASPQIATGVVVDADINSAAAIAESKLSLATDAAAGTGSRRTLGTGALQAASGADSRFGAASPPNGAASGDLGGTYPSPTVVKSVGNFTVGGQLLVPTVGALAGIVLGGDTALYRDAANRLRTDGRMYVGEGFYADPTSNPSFRSEAVTNNLVLANYLLPADTQPAFRILGDGRIQWGDGGAAGIDVSLYRRAANILATDDDTAIGPVTSNGLDANLGVYLDSTGLVNVVRASAAINALSLSVQNDTVHRFVILADGTQVWGSGAGVRDTNLYRDSVGNALRTDDTFQASTLKSDNFLYLPATASAGVGGATTGIFITSAGYIIANRGLTQTNFLTTVAGETAYRFTIRGDGRLTWSDGISAGASAYIEYDSVNDRLNTPDGFQAASINSPAITAGARTQAVVTTDDPRLLDEEGGSTITGTAAPGYITRFLDDFSADNLDRDYDQPLGHVGITVSGGVLNDATASSRILLAKPQVAVGSPYRYPRLSQKVNYGSVAGGSSGYGHLLRYIDVQNYIYTSMVGNLTLRIIKLDLNVTTTLKNVTITPVPALSTDYWVRTWMDSTGLITGEWWTTDPILGGAATFSTTYQLAGADLTKFGPAAGVMQVGFRAAQTAGNLATMDDFRIESTIGQEKDLYRDTTNNLEYGPRTNELWGTARPLPKAISNDTVWDTKGDLAIGTGADAASKLAVGTDNQVLIADSTQATGIKWGAGTPGPTGAGVPIGGTTNQVLVKTSAVDYATGWTTPSGHLPDIALAGDGLKAETVSRLTLSGVVAPTSQSIFLVRAPIRAGTLINNILCALSTLGVGTAPTLIKMAILDKTGKVLGQSANLNANTMWTAGLGIKTVALSAQVTIPSDDVYYLSFLKNGNFGTTDIQLLRVAWPTALIGAAIGGGVPLATAVTVQTDYPANGSSVTPAAGGTTSAFWFGAT